MRIIITIGSLHFSGAENVLISLANSLKAKGNEIIYIVLDKDNYSKGRTNLDYNIDIEYIGYKGNFLVKNIKRIIDINKFIVRKKPDIVISFGYILNPIVLISSMFTNVPILISERNDPKKEPKSLLFRFLRRITYPLASLLVVQTHEIQSFFTHFMKDKIRVIPNPITLINLPNKYEGVKEKTIVSVGRLDQRQKNQLLLVNSFSLISDLYKDYNLIIYGEGEDRNLIQDQIKSLGLEHRIELPGKILNIIDLLQKSTMFVLSSNFEGMPNSLIEAMSIGLPCISTDCGGGGPKMLIESYINGILVPKNDEVELSHAISFIIENPILANNMANNAIKVRDYLSIDVIIKEWETAIFDCINGH